jgi:hypothetical protein
MYLLNSIRPTHAAWREEFKSSRLGRHLPGGIESL